MCKPRSTFFKLFIIFLYQIIGIGALNIPKYPSIPGRDDFEGKQFHANLWDHDFDWTDKRVGVIGSGCSAIQIVPSIAAGRLTNSSFFFRLDIQIS